MSDILNLNGIQGLDPANSLCTIEATVVTGFECVAGEEVEQVLGLVPAQSRGRIVFDIPPERVGEVLSLRCVNTVYVILGYSLGYQYEGSQEEQIKDLCLFVEKQLDWNKGVKVWAQVMGFKGPIWKSDKEENTTVSDVNNSESSEVGSDTTSLPTFRATCYRSGDKSAHQFPSPLVACEVGGHIQDMFTWQPKMKGYDLEFVINCDPGQLYCAITLNHTSLGNRTITEYGQCTLRPTISACMARLANLQPGDLVLDPMCGTGSIPLEGALGFPFTYHLGGELVKKSVRSCRANLVNVATKEKLRAQPAMDVIQWDCILNPSLREESVDVVISDLPFGKRSGNKYDNRKLYPDVLTSMARLVRPNTGRAVLLTQDKNTMFMSIKKVSKYWTSIKTISTNIGGLAALVFVLERTNTRYESFKLF